MTKFDNLSVIGDFNAHIDNVSDTFARDFINITESLNLIQHVSGPTHAHGHILDLVFTLGLSISSLCISELFVSDHKYINFNLHLTAVHIMTFTLHYILKHFGI